MRDSIKVLHIIHSLDKTVGGPARSLPSMCLETEKYGIRNTILAYRSKDPNTACLEGSGTVVEFVEKESSRAGRLLSANYHRALKEKHYDIIHLHSLWTLPLHWAAVYGRRAGIPVISSPRGTLEQWDKFRHSVKKRTAWELYQKRDLRRSACIHATGDKEGGNLLRMGLGPVAVIPNLLNISAYPLKRYSSDPGRERTLLFLSRIHPKKGIEILLRAWKDIDPELRRNWRVVIAGDGEAEYIRSIELLIKSEYGGCGVEFIGAVYGADKVRQYHEADLFILPTYSENFGMVIAEAMACGLPVITTTGTPWQTLAVNGAGWWVDNSVEEINRCITEAIALSDQERERKGRAGRNLIETEFSAEKVAGSYSQLYRWVAEGTSPAPDFVTYDLKHQ